MLSTDSMRAVGGATLRKLGHEARDRISPAFDLDVDAIPVIADEPGQRQPGREATDRGAEPDPLNGATHAHAASESGNGIGDGGHAV